MDLAKRTTNDDGVAATNSYVATGKTFLSACGYFIWAFTIRACPSCAARSV